MVKKAEKGPARKPAAEQEQDGEEEMDGPEESLTLPASRASSAAPLASPAAAVAAGPSLANPAPLGLMGFGMTTVLLNLFNAGVIGTSGLGMIFAMGVFYGGIAQVIAGIMEFKKGNTFGFTAFISYGFFWIALVAFKLLAKWSKIGPVDSASAGFFLSIWGLFTLYMFIGTLRKNRALQVVFGSLTILFFILAAGDFSENKTITKIAGWEGLLCGFSAIYLACAEILNESFGREIVPIGVIKN
jgi:uncharacterized protein